MKIIKSKNSSYANQRFTAETNPTTAWIELVKNAVESTVSYQKKSVKSNELKHPTPVKIRVLDIAAGLPYPNFEDTFYKNKISILNYGGLNRNELFDASMFNSSVGKDNGEDLHQGVGSRASTLNWSDLMWISYKDGVAHMVVMGERTIDGRRELCYPDIPESENYIQECTEWVKANADKRGYDLTHDWHEAIVLGRSADGENTAPTQNMATHPYGFDEAKENDGWLWNKLSTDIHELPANVILVFESGKFVLHLDKTTNTRNFQTFKNKFDESVTNTTGFYEPVTLDNGDIVHFYYDPPKDINGTNGQKEPLTWRGAGTRYNFGALIWKSPDHDINQFWGVKETQAWQPFMQKLGILKKQDARHFKIFYQPTTNSVSRDRHSTHLRRKNLSIKTKTEIFSLDSVLEIIAEKRPVWFIQAIKNLNDVVKEQTSLDDEIREALEFYQQTEKFNTIDTGLINGNEWERYKTPRKNKKNYAPDPNPGPFPGPFDRKESDLPEAPNGYPGPTKKVWRRKQNNEGLSDIPYPIFVEVSQVRGNPQLFADYIEPASEKEKPTVEVVSSHRQVKIIEQMVCARIPDSENYLEQVRTSVIDVLKVALAVDTLLTKSQWKQGHITDEQKNQMLDPVILTKVIHNYQTHVDQAVKRAEKKIKSEKALEITASEKCLDPETQAHWQNNGVVLATK